MLSTSDTLQSQRHIQTVRRQKGKGWKKILHENRYQNKARVTILISDKTEFKIKIVKRDKEHFPMVKDHSKKSIIIVNIYAPNTRAPQYIRQMLTAIKGEINRKLLGLS